MPVNRAAQRSRLRRARAAVAPPRARAAARKVARRILREPAFRNSSTIALYLPARGEIDVSVIFEAAWRLGKQVCVPRIRHGRLQFVRCTPGWPLRRGPYDIAEPVPGAPLVMTNRIPLIVTPLVAFDAVGNRLGQGGGYYDRAFGALTRGRFRRQVLLGAAYAFQQTGPLEPAYWDVPLAAVATEKRRFPRHSGYFAR